jgi:DNA invertase Pin-like site-specific DNA recombinase
MTTANLLVPAAQYLRKSTEHQQYSLENQSMAIKKYAESHGFRVVLTYFDAKTGLVFKQRGGLRQMLQDVVTGKTPYKIILVYDVSRWGRFQDTDESAHYEFLCKSSGVPVHYCAETFANDGALPSLIMKALKRTMAGEFSRELGVKVLAGHKRLARLGFRQGAIPGYGLRRMLVSASGTPKQELKDGERKSIATDRVILVPGPAPEVQVVKDIFRMFVSEKLCTNAIARELNSRSIPYIGGVTWTYQGVSAVLTAPKYTGCHVYGRTSIRLSTPRIKLPKSEWVLTPEAFEPLVDSSIFSEAQKIVRARTCNKSDQELLDGLRALLASKGRLSRPVIRDCAEVPAPSTYGYRFGSLQRAYELIGYGHPDQFGPEDLRRRTTGLRDELITRIAAMFPDEVSITRPGGRWRRRLQLPSGLMVSVLIGRPIQRKCSVSWRIDPAKHEREFVTLLARLAKENRSFLDFHVLPNIDRAKSFHVSLADPWLNRGRPLSGLSTFCEVVARHDGRDHGTGDERSSGDGQYHGDFRLDQRIDRSDGDGGGAGVDCHQSADGDDRAWHDPAVHCHGHIHRRNHTGSDAERALDFDSCSGGDDQQHDGHGGTRQHANGGDDDHRHQFWDGECNRDAGGESGGAGVDCD